MGSAGAHGADGHDERRGLRRGLVDGLGARGGVQGRKAQVAVLAVHQLRGRHGGVAGGLRTGERGGGCGDAGERGEEGAREEGGGKRRRLKEEAPTVFGIGKSKSVPVLMPPRKVP